MHLSGFVPHSAEASPTSTQSTGSVTGLTSVIVSCTDLETPGGTLQTNNPCVRFSCTSPFLRSPCGEIGCSSQTDRAIIEIHRYPSHVVQPLQSAFHHFIGCRLHVSHSSQVCSKVMCCSYCCLAVYDVDTGVMEGIDPI